MDVIRITAAFGKQVVLPTKQHLVVIGRDARPSGVMISQLVAGTLQSLGIDVIDLGLSTTPSVALAVPQLQASGGIVITASHNPSEWNALKLLNQHGEYISAVTAQQVFQLAAEDNPTFVIADQVGKYIAQAGGYINQHIEQILALPLVDKRAIRRRKLRVVVDAVNSTGGLAVPPLLQALGIDYMLLYGDPTGVFAHDPEPTTQNLGTLMATLQQGGYDLGIAVDPDVDRLVIVDEQGEPWGEDYTLVAVADYVLRHTPGNTVSNLSSSSVLQVVTAQHGGTYTPCPVGEMYIVAQMKATNAVIGGEGNGGVIYPPLHYGRDALVGIALLLAHLAQSGMTASQLRQTYPTYVMHKTKLRLTPELDAATILAAVQHKYQAYPINTAEGLKVTLADGWFHLRQSNTEPIIRLHVEGHNEHKAKQMAMEVLQTIQQEFPSMRIV
jgi:phosphomannomutase